MTYAVVVTFQIREGAMDAFLPAMIQNAQTSLAEEPGCFRFDVCTDPDRPCEVHLYELYADREAFDAHLNSAHFKAYNARVASMLEGKDIRTFSQVVS